MRPDCGGHVCEKKKKTEQGVAKKLIIFDEIFIPEQVSKFAYGDGK